MSYDSRLAGDAAEYILACLLRNKHGLISQRFDVEGLDLIVFDPNHHLFPKEAKSPLFIQVKIRGGGNPTGMGAGTIKKIERIMKNLGVDESSVYLAAGFFKDDIRTIKFYLVPWKAKDRLLSKSGKEVRLSKKKLENLKDELNIIVI